MNNKETYEIRFWHGSDGKDFTRWIINTPPEYLPNGAVQFTCAQNLEHYINGTIEVVKRSKEE